MIWKSWVERVNFDYDMGEETMNIEVRLDGREIGSFVAGSGQGVNLDAMARGGRIQYENRQASVAIEEEQMEFPKVTLVRHKHRRTVNIHVEVEEDVFVTGPSGDERVERKVGEEMPVYDTIPEEYFLPIMRAARADPDFWDLARDTFR